jgi:hypothetical protein
MVQVSQSATIQFANRKSTTGIHILRVEETSARSLDMKHRRLGYLCIGVHYLIREDGLLEHGRDREAVGAMLCPQHETTLLIALSGSPMTVAQEKTLDILLTKLRGAYPGVEVQHPNY